VPKVIFRSAPNQQILADIAKNDKNQDLRVTAAWTLGDKRILADIAKNHPDKGVREHAAELLTIPKQKLVAPR
jgi:hypothetical protein